MFIEYRIARNQRKLAKLRAKRETTLEILSKIEKYPRSLIDNTIRYSGEIAKTQVYIKQLTARINPHESLKVTT